MSTKINISLFLAIGLIFCHPLLFAQTSLRGIYLSGQDFSNNKISFSPIPGKKYRLQLNEFFEQPTIKVTIGDSTVTLSKDGIFGYRDNQNIFHRFYKRINYAILNPSETILLYSRTILGGYKNAQTIVQYYFSSDANAAVLPLTKCNIKKAFPNDSAFHEFLDMYFSSDKSLLAYDDFYKMYKLNRVFQFSKQMISKKTNQIITN